MRNAVFWDIKPPVRTSQEKPYVSDTEPSRLMLCKSIGFHGGDYEKCRLMGCDAFVALVRSDASVERVASNIRVERISELGTLAVSQCASVASYC
jgi:hypothetical protein